MSTPPDREAPAEAPIEAVFRRRWSPRSFTDRPVSDAHLASLIEAARWASSCFNAQPLHLVVARRDREPEQHAALAACLSDNNRVWAPKAPVLMVAIARLDFAHNGKPNRHAAYDTGAAMAQLAVQAAALGLQVHQMGGYDMDTARAVLSIPEGFELRAALAIGHPGAAETLPEELAARETAPRQRRPVAEWVHYGAWKA